MSGGDEEGRGRAEEERRLREALGKPGREAGPGDLGFGAKDGETAPEGSPDEAVERAAAGWSGREEGEEEAR